MALVGARPPPTLSAARPPPTLGRLRRTRCRSWRLVARIPTRKTAMAGICGRSKAGAPTVSSAIVDVHRRSGAAASEVLAETGQRRARPASAQVWPGHPSRSALRVWPCHWCGATAPERRELFPRSARCLITACSAFGVGVPLWQQATKHSRSGNHAKTNSSGRRLCHDCVF